MIMPVFMEASPCSVLSKYVISELEIIQKNVEKWIDSGKKVLKKKLFLSILPLPFLIQLNNLLLLTKMLLGQYETFKCSFGHMVLASDIVSVSKAK